MKLILGVFLIVAFNLKCIANDAIENVLDRYHQAAAKADFTQYMGAMSDDSVFLGTDPEERWTKTEFAAFAKPYFAQKIGWEYVPFKRNITLIKDGEIAYFDELLNNKSYGICRGTGVLVFTQGQWKIAQYSLSIPIPNNMAKPVVALIAESLIKVNIDD